MYDEISDKLYELLSETYYLPEGEVKNRLLEEAVREADISKHWADQFEARLSLVQAGTFSGRSEKSMTAFAWCLAKYRADPEKYEQWQHRVFWSFKWLVAVPENFPQISREKAEELGDQMEAMYREYGYTLRPLYSARMKFAIRRGDEKTARENFFKMQNEPRDEMSDCAACEIDKQIDYHEFLGDYETAVSVAAPNLNGELSCAEVPQRTYCGVLRSLAKLGRTEEGDEYQAKAYRMIRGNPNFLSSVAEQMNYLVHRRRNAIACRMLERHMAWALESFSHGARFDFYLAARNALAGMGKKKARRAFHFPASFPARDPAGEYEIAPLIDWFTNQIEEIAALFNQRNGNTHFSDVLPGLSLY